MPSTLTIQNRQLAISATEGLRHLESADWSASVHPTQEFLALLALRLVLAGYLIGTVTKTVDPDGQTRIHVEAPSGNVRMDERFRAVAALLEPLRYYASQSGISLTLTADETGAVPIPVLIVGGAVAVSAVVAQAYVVMYVADKAGQIVDGAFKRRAAASEVQRADAEVIKLVNNHVQREQAAGKALPLDEGTRIAIGGLQTRIGSLVKNAFESEKKEGFPLWGWPVAGLTAAAVATAIIIYRKKRTTHARN